jgi:hypothetical protein
MARSFETDGVQSQKTVCNVVRAPVELPLLLAAPDRRLRVSLDLANLDSCTRQFMLAELESDVAAGTLYRSPQLTEQGLLQYCRLLRAALESGTEASFAEALWRLQAVMPPGRWQHARAVGPEEALEAATVRLAEREFHRFYIRGLCRRALDQGLHTLEIYRAKPAEAGRAPSEAMIGIRVTATSLLEDLSGVFDSWPPHGLPQCRDPGLSVRLP